MCISSVVYVPAVMYNGARITGWRVENGSILSEDGAGASVQVSYYAGTTVVHADYEAAPGCPGRGTATTYIYVVDQINGQYCAAMRVGSPQAAVYPNPADAYVDVRSPFSNNKPYRVELHRALQPEHSTLGCTHRLKCKKGRRFMRLPFLHFTGSGSAVMSSQRKMPVIRLALPPSRRAWRLPCARAGRWRRG